MEYDHPLAYHAHRPGAQNKIYGHPQPATHSLRRTGTEQAHVATLYSLFVYPTHQGKGYASNLVSAAIQAAQAHGKTSASLMEYMRRIKLPYISTNKLISSSMVDMTRMGLWRWSGKSRNR
ncbi:MAG: N-acetyltransferase [Hymenobacter sp.]|nr:MAG: N-acetyltransferase [Hymenobacter sp.]